MAHLDLHHLVDRPRPAIFRQHIEGRIRHTQLMLYISTVASLGLVAVAAYILTHAQ